MNREIDPSVEQRIFQLLCEHAFPADHRQGIRLHVAGCLNDLDANVDFRIQCQQAGFGLFGLPQGEFDPREPITSGRDIARHSSTSRRSAGAGAPQARWSRRSVASGSGADGRSWQLSTSAAIRSLLPAPFVSGPSRFRCRAISARATSWKFLAQCADARANVHQSQRLLKLHHFRLHDQFSPFRFTLALTNVR